MCHANFFNITDGRTCPDHNGTELTSLAEARREALATFGDLVKTERSGIPEWRIDIADFEGTILLTLIVNMKEVRPEVA